MKKFGLLIAFIYKSRRVHKSLFTWVKYGTRSGTGFYFHLFHL